MLTLTWNLKNHASIWGFQSGCLEICYLEIWLYWNNGIFIDNLNADFITWMASIFLNLKIDKINEILVVHKLLHTNKLKAKQTYIERLPFQCTSYLQVNRSHYEGTLPLRYGTTLEEAASWFDESAFSCITLSSSLLEQLAVIMYSQREVDFSPCIYINLMNICIINFDYFLKKLAAPPLY